jgi:hypothetical protein
MKRSRLQMRWQPSPRPHGSAATLASRSGVEIVRSRSSSRLAVLEHHLPLALLIEDESPLLGYNEQRALERMSP